MFKKSKSSYDTQISGLTDLYNDTIKKARDAADVQARKDLTTEADRLAAKILSVEKEKEWHKTKWSIKHPFSKR